MGRLTPTQNLKRKDFEYNLPAEKIAQRPLEKRDESKMLVLKRYSGAIEHRCFREIGLYLEPGDALVLNETKVFPARLIGQKATGGKVDVLLLEEQSSRVWTALVRNLKPGSTVVFSDGSKAILRGGERLPSGEAVLEFSCDPASLIQTLGQIPLPPYIHRPPQAEDKERYQTIYAKEPGSVAAPTAGLHFTPELLEQLKGQGIRLVPLTLHVGWGTFRGIQTDNVTEHLMLSEHYRLSSEAAEILQQVRLDKKRIVAVGTSTVRVLETVFQQKGAFCGSESSTDLFIYPGHLFQAVDAMVTNFHLPAMPPLVMTGAFVSESLPWEDGRTMLFTAYQEALRRDYRFASYGDAMLIL